MEPQERLCGKLSGRQECLYVNIQKLREGEEKAAIGILKSVIVNYCLQVLQSLYICVSLQPQTICDNTGRRCGTKSPYDFFQ